MKLELQRVVADIETNRSLDLLSGSVKSNPLKERERETTLRRARDLLIDRTATESVRPADR